MPERSCPGYPLAKSGLLRRRLGGNIDTRPCAKFGITGAVGLGLARHLLQVLALLGICRMNAGAPIPLPESGLLLVRVNSVFWAADGS